MFEGLKNYVLMVVIPKGVYVLKKACQKSGVLKEKC